MADGFRITESGDSRISEASDTRITENLIVASASLSGAGSVSVTGNTSSFVSCSLSSTGSKLTAAVLQTEADPITLSATGSMTATGGNFFSQNLNVSGTGTSSYLGLNTFSISSTLNATGSATFNGIKIKNAATSLSASGSFVNDGFNFVHFGKFESKSQDLTRITEAGDIRFTEASDTRIVVDQTSNAALGFLSADCTQIFFSSEAFFKWNGQWTTFTPKVKQSGVWDDPLAIYKKIDANTWKRAF